MNKKIKVIDLFNIIANEEELPQTIIYQGIIYNYTKNEYGEGYLYIDEDDDYNWLTDDIWCDDKEVLNDDIEILEDNTEEIEEIQEISDEYFNMLSDEAKVKWLKSYIKEDRNKINELVKVVKEIRKDLNK